MDGYEGGNSIGDAHVFTREDKRKRGSYMSRTEVPDRIRRLRAGFDRYVAAFDRHPPFHAGQLAMHQRVIALRRQLGSAERAIASDHFLQQLRQLLEAWGIASRGARLAELERF
jgi:hypothetical protein